jgi:hypothetical protein
MLKPYCYRICYRNQSFPVAEATYSSPERRVETRCRIALHGLGDVRIEVKRGADRGVAQALLRDFWMHSGEQQLGGVSMSQIMKAYTR